MQRPRIPVTGLLLMVLAAKAVAHDLNDKFSIGAVVAGVLQCQRLSGTAGADDDCGGALPLQPEAGFRPTGSDEFFLRLGFARGNGINDKSPFLLAPWGADLHDDVRDINGSGRDHLLNAWYRHTFSLQQDATLAATAGIISATDFLDENAYANDEYTQFMNQALVNGPRSYVPSYDTGAALAWQAGPWAVHAVAMDVSENADGEGYMYYGVQLGYALQSGLGEGNYRVLVDRTSEDFRDPDGGSGHNRSAVLLSLDQELGDTLGAFLRIGWRNNDAAIHYDSVWSGGLDIRGGPWGRPRDNIGLGYAWLDGGNLDVRQTHVAETYYRLVFSDQLALSADVQYMNDHIRHARDPSGFILGLRMTAEF